MTGDVRGVDIAESPEGTLRTTRTEGKKTKMVAIEHETTSQITVWYNVLLAIRRRWCRYEDVAEKQIISALLWETGLVNGATGYVYAVLKEAANEARRTGLLINPNHHTQETYSTSVGNTDRMKPSADGWERTQGILSRHLGQGAEKLWLILQSRAPHGTRADLDKLLGKNFKNK